LSRSEADRIADILDATTELADLVVRGKQAYDDVYRESLESRSASTGTSADAITHTWSGSTRSPGDVRDLLDQRVRQRRTRPRR
jgi:hypothetical protein